jgi:hypothetical protein
MQLDGQFALCLAAVECPAKVKKNVHKGELYVLNVPFLFIIWDTFSN